VRFPLSRLPSEEAFQAKAAEETPSDLFNEASGEALRELFNEVSSEMFNEASNCVVLAEATSRRVCHCQCHRPCTRRIEEVDDVLAVELEELLDTVPNEALAEKLVFMLDETLAVMLDEVLDRAAYVLLWCVSDVVLDRAAYVLLWCVSDVVLDRAAYVLLWYVSEVVLDRAAYVLFVSNVVLAETLEEDVSKEMLMEELTEALRYPSPRERCMHPLIQTREHTSVGDSVDTGAAELVAGPMQDPEALRVPFVHAQALEFKQGSNHGWLYEMFSTQVKLGRSLLL